MAIVNSLGRMEIFSSSWMSYSLMKSSPFFMVSLMLGGYSSLQNVVGFLTISFLK
jgi:hypothetical protein